ncbi:MAG: type II secretion system F family protein [Methanomassiliicoccus sp.]|nr:type II secretion system F family protein [Methanomassiliicoccus sp.]
MKKDAWLRDLRMKEQTYYKLILVSVVVLGIVVPAILTLVLAPYLSGMLLVVVYVVPIFGIFVIFMLPAVYTSRRKVEVEQNMPMFVTTMAALSTSDMPFESVFYILSTKKEYGQLARDAKQICRLIKHYSVGAAEACRFIAVRTSCQMEANFFNRLSHSLDVGEKLDRFMANEHDVMMDEYVLRAEATLKDLDFVKEIYTGLTTSLIFTAVFVCIMPMFGSGGVEVLMIGVVFSFAALESFFIYLLKTKVPKDRIWLGWRAKIKRGMVTDKDRLIFTSVLIAVLGIILLSFIMIPSGLPMTFIASTIFLPALFPGVLILREEKAIEKRDNLFGAFIRSLGRSSEVSGTTMADGVKKLAMHSFGPLTDMVKNLSKRLSLHISVSDSWKRFSAETSSDLIDKFGEMYVTCMQNGSKAEPTSVFISNNMFRVLSIRKKRSQTASSFVGILYGVMISLAVTLYITIGIVGYMSDVMSSVVIDNSGSDSAFLNSILSGNINIAEIQLMVFAVIIVHAVLSSLMLPMIKGGHIVGSVVHFIALIWIASAASMISETLISGLLTSG